MVSSAGKEIFHTSNYIYSAKCDLHRFLLTPTMYYSWLLQQHLESAAMICEAERKHSGELNANVSMLTLELLI